MKIVHLTAGTGSFHCGVCLRDHALVKALGRLGHDAQMSPLYLPFVLEGKHEHVGDRILLGAISLYLQNGVSFFRRAGAPLARLLDAPPLLRLASRRVGVTQAAKLGRMTLSMLKGELGPQAEALEHMTDYLQSAGRPDVVCLSNALLIGTARTISKSLDVPVICSLQGEDGFLDELPQPWRGRCWDELQRRCADVDAFVAASDYYRTLMQERLGLPSDRIHTVHNGIDLEGYFPAASPPDPPAIGYLARLCHAKGLHTLVDAFVLIKLRGRIDGLKLRIAGTITAADKPYVRKLTRVLKGHGLLDHVELETRVTLERKQEFLRSISVLSVPATYGESFGLYLIEAMASGVPLVQPDRGAFGELLDVGRAGILSRPDDFVDLADKIEGLLLDKQRLHDLGQAGRASAVEHFNMDRMGRQFADIVEQCVRPR